MPEQDINKNGEKSPDSVEQIPSAADSVASAQVTDEATVAAAPEPETEAPAAAEVREQPPTDEHDLHDNPDSRTAGTDTDTSGPSDSDQIASREEDLSPASASLADWSLENLTNVRAEATNASPQAQSLTTNHTEAEEAESAEKRGPSTTVREEVPVATEVTLASDTSAILQPQKGEDMQQPPALTAAQTFDAKPPQTTSETSPVEARENDLSSQAGPAVTGPNVEQPPGSMDAQETGSKPDKPKRGRPRTPRNQQPSPPTEASAPGPAPGPQHLSAQQTEPEKTNKTESVITGGDQPLQVNINGQVRLASQPINVSIWDRRTPTPPASEARPDGNGGRNNHESRRAGSNPKIPWVPIFAMIGLALLFVFVVLLICCWPPAWPPRPRATPTPTPSASGFFTDDLYGFTIRQPQLPGVALIPHDTDPGCKGIVFAPAAYGPSPSQSAYPRLKVCFMAFDNARPPNDLDGQLRALCDHIENNTLSKPIRGFMRSTKIGADQLAARETHLRGQDREVKNDVKLYEAVVEFDQRFYAIEAADLVNNWENTWPVFRAAIDTLEFADNVVIPRDAPVVLP